MRGRWTAGALAFVLAACARDKAPDGASIIAIGPGDVRIVPAPVARSVTSRILPPVPHIAGSVPLLNGEPARIRIGFDGDELPESVDPLQRQMLVYPLDAYRALFPAGERVVLDERIAALRRLLADRPEFMDQEEIPVLPDAAAPQDFRARVRYLRFDGGAGVAFITRYTPAADSARSPLVWTFQGLTDDGRYWISFFHPIEVPGLPDNDSPDVVGHYVDALHASLFTPSPDALAALARTVRVREPPPLPPEG
ncbi:MAG TPA: hypothetical protein VM759_00920 [Longimicrobium sp.]|nr:hypothetical protein [Longimicrobium sp.]